MKKYLIRWTETHEQEVYANDQDEACDLAEVNMQAETYLNSEIKDIEPLEEREKESEFDTVEERNGDR